MAEQIVVELASVAPRERLIAGEAAPMQVRMNFCAEVADRRQEGTAHVLLTERVDSLAVARVQPNLHDGLSVDLDAPLGRDDRRRVDPLSLWRLAWSAARALDRRRVRDRQRDRFPGLRLHRHRQVRRGVFAVANQRGRDLECQSGIEQL